MILRYPALSTLYLCILLLLFINPTAALHSKPRPPRVHHDTGPARADRSKYVAHPAADLVCRPFGECEPCPPGELDQPFCLPFGNRRLLHCMPADKHHPAGEGADNRQPAGEVPAWESCGRVVRKEREEFWQFVTANMLFLIVALTILWARSSALAAAQYRQLAARIGIHGGSWRT